MTAQPAKTRRSLSGRQQRRLPRPNFRVDGRQERSPLLVAEDQPCTLPISRKGRSVCTVLRKRRCRAADIDTALCNPSRILRLAGGIHPKSGERSVIVSAGGQKYSYEMLWNLTGNDNSATAQAVSKAGTYPRHPREPAQGEVPEDPQPCRLRQSRKSSISSRSKRESKAAEALHQQAGAIARTRVGSTQRKLDGRAPRGCRHC